MLDHPDFFNVRKMAMTFCVGPIAFLLLVAGISTAAHQFRSLHASMESCTALNTANSVSGLYGNECP